MKTLIKLLALAAVALPFAANAQQVLTLKGAPASSGDQVTVGDVFDNAGTMAGVVLGHRLGATVILDAATVQSTVGANGGYWANPRGQRRILVTAENAGAKPIAAETPAPPENPFTHQPQAIAAATTTTLNNPFATVSGANVPAASAPVASASVARPPAAYTAALAAQAPAAHGAVVVHRQESVEVTWASAGIALSMSGVATKDAAVGDTVTIQIPTPKKTIDAIITGPGRAITGPGADQYLTNLQLSSR